MKKSVVGEVQEGILVRPERFELPTYCSGGNRSIQLSYGRKPIRTVYTKGERSM